MRNEGTRSRNPHTRERGATAGHEGSRGASSSRPGSGTVPALARPRSTSNETHAPLPGLVIHLRPTGRAQTSSAVVGRPLIAWGK